ncbi:NAD-dependent epimerase/dehydratase family protein [Arthrobacter sp. GMC3]|uniref:NAD-dependent epimerase/dehydratase family protein n=1 Tax=Arthrobacter sp. GMC3 TaxID=2058894 RepID=UPI0015E3988E|nr:NAD-dependent epimerase/dehydratase family protein [Arthrobacter sp. GMC3]
MANILVLGGTGWLGRIVAEKALSAGHCVTALARGQTGDFPAGVSAVVGDRDAPGVYAPLAGTRWDLVVELTRIPAHAGPAVQTIQAEDWVFVSSCSVYANHSVPGEGEEVALLEPLDSSADYTTELYGEAKSACEKLTVQARGGRALMVRPGLIGGPGDPSGRSTYWPLRLADAREPVLLPQDDGDYRQSVQIIDARDLAAFILTAGLAGRTGAVNAVGASIPLDEALLAAQAAAGTEPALVRYPLSRMADDGVAPWSGPRSLPLVLPPGPEHAGFARRSDAMALSLGLERRSLEESFRDIIAFDEPWDGRQLASGLSAPDEAALMRLQVGWKA